ncbi:hypothetical protein IAT38_002233 [Cryptococcus sp. DSM 104549]
MLAPRPRPHPRISTPSSLLTSSPPSSTTWTGGWSDTDTELPRAYSGTREDGMPRRGRGGGGESTAPSEYSDDGTEVAPSTLPPSGPSAYGPRWTGAKEGKLIDIDYDDEGQVEEKEKEMAPGDKLRDLLRQMDEEVRRAGPAPVTSREPRPRGLRAEVESKPAGWLRGAGAGAGARRNLYAQERREEEQEASEDEDEGDGQEAHVPASPPSSSERQKVSDEESPPTPPPRFGNPYAARRVSGEKRGFGGIPGRLPSRAAVLLQSTSRSPPPEPEPETRSPPTQLEAYIASHPAEPSTSRQTSLSLSRSLASSHGSSASRKGKERERRPEEEEEVVGRRAGVSPALPTPLESSTRRRFREREGQQPTPPPEGTPSRSPSPPTPPAQPQYQRPRHPQPPPQALASSPPHPPTPRRRRPPPPTPRRVSIDLAPSDMEEFAQNAGGLEVRAEVELDLDEGLSRLGWEESVSESVVEEGEGSGGYGGKEEVVERGGEWEDEDEERERLERSSTARPRGSSQVLLESSLWQSQSRSHSHNNSHTHYRSFSLSKSPRASPPAPSPQRRAAPTHAQAYSPSPPLPALPEMDISQESSSSEVDTYSSRRAALFRSGSKSASVSRNASGLANASTSASGAGTGSALGASTGSLSGRRSFERSASHREKILERSRAEVSMREEREGVAAEELPSEREEEEEEERRKSGQGTASYRSTESSPRGNASSRFYSPSSAHPSPAAGPSTSLHRSTRFSPSPMPAQHTPRRLSDMPVPPQQPIQVGMAFVSTPSPARRPSPRSSSSPRGNTTLGPGTTPKPPGAWLSTPAGQGTGRVRASPLRHELGASVSGRSAREGGREERLEWEDEGTGDVSILRLKVSPRRSPGRNVSVQEEGDGEGEHEGDVSWTARLTRSLTGSLPKRIPVPPRSTIYQTTQPMLAAASSHSTTTLTDVRTAQTAWLSTISTISSQPAPASSLSMSNRAASAAARGVAKTWTWGKWAWWLTLEIVLLWAVFRVTLDYAGSSFRLSMDPFSPLARPLGLAPPAPAGITTGSSAAQGTRSGPVWSEWSASFRGTPIELGVHIPGALQTLVGKHGSANFFDLLESWEVWRKMVGDEWAQAGRSGVGMVGGVPT